MESRTNSCVGRLPTLPAHGLSPELRDYLTQLSEAYVDMNQQLMQLKIEQVGGPDGTLTREQAMQLLGVKHSKFNLIKVELERAPSPGAYPRYTFASCRNWLLSHAPTTTSKVEVEQLLERRLDALRSRSRRA